MPDDVEKFLNESEQFETRRQELIKDLLKQKDAAVKAFDEKLAKLGYHQAEKKRSHHRKSAQAVKQTAAAKPPK